jgi:formylglycine-generating enzyme required for sulfatase activity
VGLYPDGISPSGLLDAAGNVWEWTTSIRKDYPYRLDDGREKIDESSGRVVRGGSWLDNQDVARCAFRYNDFPVDRDVDLGFRCCVSPGSRFCEAP